jgi:hypothetical protein
VQVEGRLKIPIEIAGRPLDPEDEEPDRVGQYRDVRDMRIDRAMVGNAKVFRPEGWEVALVVSEEIKNALENMGATGTRFEEV